MRLRLLAGIFILAIFSIFACSHRRQQIVAPDYSNWPKPYSKKMPALHNGNSVELLHELFYKGDLNETMEFVSLVYNESQAPWLMFYDKEYRGGIPGTIKTDRTIFEYKDNKWVFVTVVDYNKSRDEADRYLINV